MEPTTTITIDLEANLPPARTYFRATDVAPRLETDENGAPVITCTNGESYRASWGASWCRTTIEHQDENLVVLRVKWNNKHAFCQGQFYFFVRDPRKGWRKTNKTGAKKYIEAAGLDI